MSSQLFSSLLLWIAITAGMVAQEVVGKLSAAMEKREVVAQKTPVWDTAERFYLCHQVTFETPDDEDEASEPETTPLPETASEPTAEAEPSASAPATAEETPSPGADEPVESSAAEPVSAETPIAEEPAPAAGANGASAEPAAAEDMAASPAAGDAPAETTAADQPEGAAQPVTAAEPPASPRAPESPAKTPSAPAPSDELPAPTDSPAQRPSDAPQTGAADKAWKRLPAITPNDPAPRVPLTRPPTAADYPWPSPSAPDASPSTPSETDAQRLIRERAALKAAERTKRIELWKWSRYSPLRPPAQPTPMMGGADTTIPSLR